MTRLDANDKATGKSLYVADIAFPGLCHVAFARSTMAHARIGRINVDAAAAMLGVVGVFTADDVALGTYGRSVEDSPLLARDKVRFIGERVAAVVAEERVIAEQAAALIEVDYEPLPAVTTLSEALAQDAPRVHDTPWKYPGSAAKEAYGPNVSYRHSEGSLETFEAEFARSAHKVDVHYKTVGVHQGYLEPQACLADYHGDGSVTLWLTNKAPYRLRRMLNHCIGVDPEKVDIQPIALGGDFGGKGSLGDAPIAVELSRLVGRPIKSVLRYSEDLTATNPRHPSEVRVRIGCDPDGQLSAVAIDALLDGGAYAGFAPRASGPQAIADAPPYKVPVFYSEIIRAYTNTVPRGQMRAPGSPQGVFAFESAMDELAAVAGIDPIELRKRNLLHSGDAGAIGRKWVEHRSEETVDAALQAFIEKPAPSGWLYGKGISFDGRHTTTKANTSLRISPTDDGCRVEIPIIETGTGSHTVMRELIAEYLGFQRDQVEVVGVSTAQLPDDQGAGGSRVTASFAVAVDAAAKLWHNRLHDESVVVTFDGSFGPEVGTYICQIAQVAVDPESGELKVLELLSAIDVAEIINPLAWQMQVDGGAIMGFGYACLEDLDEAGGQVWAANLGEFKLCSAADAPPLRTVRLPGAIGVGMANVKSIGESTTPPVSAAIANAIYAATGCRIRQLPITAERIWLAMNEQGARL